MLQLGQSSSARHIHPGVQRLPEHPQQQRRERLHGGERPIGRLQSVHETFPS